MNFDKRLAFRGIRALYGNDGFEKLQSSHVTVIGVGGIGSWATEALCRTAIGSLTLIDNDIIELTNSNRQLHTTSKTVGKCKSQRQLLDLLHHYQEKYRKCVLQLNL